MSRKYVKEIVPKGNLRCMRIYPVELTKKNLSKLKTVGIKLTKKQAVDLGTSLLVASQEWEEMDLTGHRLKKRSDDTYQLTLTSYTKD